MGADCLQELCKQAINTSQPLVGVPANLWMEVTQMWMHCQHPAQGWAYTLIALYTPCATTDQAGK